MFNNIFFASLGFTFGTMAMVIAGFEIANPTVGNSINLILLFIAGFLNYLSAFINVNSIIERIIENA